MQTFTDLIDAFGVAALAKMLGVAESHVRTMKARDSVPPEYWGVLIEKATERGIEGVTYQALRGLRTRRFAPPEPARPAPSTESAAA